MQLLFVKIYKIIKRVKFYFLQPIDWFFSFCLLYLNGCKFDSFLSIGIPYINISIGGKCIIGAKFRMNNRVSSNPIGRFNSCSIVVGRKGTLVIGKNVGMSSTAIVCHEKIEIGDNVKFGGNVVIYDTDFHSLNSQDRLNPDKDIIGTKTKSILIGNNVFVGAHTTILKGVSIGDNSVVGACSVVTKDIPSNEIWAGIPIKFIRLVH